MKVKMMKRQPLEDEKATLIRSFKDTRASILEIAGTVPTNRVGEAFIGSWGILDLLAHLRGWDLTNHQSAKDILVGKLPDFYSEYDQDWASYNAKLVALHRQDSLEKMISSVEESHSDLVAFLELLKPDNVFDDHGVRRGNYKVTISRLIEAETKDEQKHLDQIHGFLG